MATIQEILDKINASKSNNINNNSFIDLMRQISGNPEDATAPVNDTNSIYGHIVQMYTTLYDGGVDYGVVANYVESIEGIYNSLATVISVHEDKYKLDSLYADKLTLDSLYADKDKLDQLFADKAIIDRVHTSIDKLDAVYADILNIDTVSNNLANIGIVAESDDNITIVADNVTDVNTVADNMTVLNEIYNNRVEIYAADDNAVIATTKAAEAATSAEEASISEATTLEYKNDVNAMKVIIESIYDTFDDRFLGTKTASPALDNDGNALIDGAMYFDTTDNAMKVYDVGTTTWYSIPQIYLSGLLDVELTSITTGDILVWNGTKWSNTANPKVDSIQLNGGSGTEGTISWNSTEQTLDITQDGTTLQVGQELQYIVRNVSGSTIANGTFVGFAGVTSDSNRIIASPFDTSTMTAIKLIGFATEDIANGVNGRVTNFGYVRGLDTRGIAVTGMSVGDEDWSDGDVLYVHPTVAGKLTKVAPTSRIKAPVATVTNRHQTAGELFVNVIAIDQLKIDHGEIAYDRTTKLIGLTSTVAELNWVNGVTSAIQTQINTKSPLSSPAFTGTPTAPTATAGTNDTQLATTAFVTSAFVTSAVGNPNVYQGAYGFNWDYSTDTYVRTGAAGYTSIQAMMKRCVLNADGTVNYYLDPTNSNFKADGTPSVLTGADGNVMVQVPKFYAKIETVGNVDKYSISLTPDAGYVVHPWFVKAGVEVDYRYYRAYTGFNSGGKLKSISGVTPTRTQTIATFRSQAVANGTGWHLTDWNAVNAIKLLCYIEFNDYIVTDYIGTGNDTGTDYGITTGQSNAIGNASSPSTNNNTWMSYRGIENFYADCWEFLDGVNINNYVFYVNQNYTTFASDVFTGDYVSKGTTIAASASYITRCAVSISGGWIPSVIGGASTTYYGDGFWSATGATLALFGGSAANGALGSAGALYVSNASSVSSAIVGGAVCF